MVDLSENKLPGNTRIIFMGTPDFAVPSLKALVENGYNVLSVITQPDSQKGRGRKVIPSPVKQAATDYGLEILQPEKVSSSDFYKEVRNRTPDLFVVVAFGQILKADLLNIPSWGALNLHASLLPGYRGAAPIHWAVLNDEIKTGLTAMKMDEGLDTGPILRQEELSILPNETAGQLHDRLAEISGPFLLRTLKELSQGRLTAHPQEERRATYASKIDKRISHVKWDQSAQTISAFIRALDPWPGAFATIGKKNIKLFSPRVMDENRSEGTPGRVVCYSEEGLEVEAANGIVQIRELQAPGKKRLPAKDFLRGFPLEENAVLR